MSQPQTEWSHNEETRAAFEAHLAAAEMTRAEGAKKISVTETRLSKYLNLHQPAADGQPRRPEPDMKTIEAKVRNYLRHISRRSAERGTLFRTSVAAQVETTLKAIRRTGDIGLVHGDAGIGKTCGCDIFCQQNTDTLFLTATDYNSSASHIGAALLEAYCESAGDRPEGGNKMLWLEHQLRGSERIIIVDEAHLLKFKALRLLFSLHNATRVPVALVGNAEVLGTLRRNPQLFSRIGQNAAVRVRDDSEEIAKKMIEQLCPESGAALIEPAVNIIAKFGHLRTLRKQLTLAADIFRARPSAGWEAAFTAAGTRLLKAD